MLCRKVSHKLLFVILVNLIILFIVMKVRNVNQTLLSVY